MCLEQEVERYWQSDSAWIYPWDCKGSGLIYGVITPIGRVSALQAEGWEFESLWLHCSIINNLFIIRVNWSPFWEQINSVVFHEGEKQKDSVIATAEKHIADM